jgi:hypothetical protein
MIAYWRPIATKRALPSGGVPNRTSQKLCHENGFHSPRKTIWPQVRLWEVAVD